VDNEGAAISMEFCISDNLCMCTRHAYDRNVFPLWVGWIYIRLISFEFMRQSHRSTVHELNDTFRDGRS